MKKQEVEIPAAVTLSEEELAQVSGGWLPMPLSKVLELLKRIRLYVVETKPST